MTLLPLAVFGFVYLGMLLGGLPRLRLDRTGIALLGAIVLLATGTVSLEEATRAVHVPTLALLFGLMVVSAQLKLGGFYSWVARRLATRARSPATLLAVVVAGAGLLSAVFSNDIVCLALTPVVIDLCRRRAFEPVPFLLGLAAAANVGSAATLIGNPQNMLIGQSLGLSFGAYLGLAGPVALAGLAVTWGVIALLRRGALRASHPAVAEPEIAAPVADRWQAAKGLVVALALLAVFLFSDLPREVAALAGAGILLTSSRLHSEDMLGLVDWQLLVLFVGLFVVNHAFEATPYPAQALAAVAGGPLDPGSRPGLFAWAAVLSNAVSNVPAVMLLLPRAREPGDGPVLALASTLAGNLLLVGSIANLIVARGAARAGISIDWKAHARIGVPVTLATLALAAAALVVAG